MCAQGGTRHHHDTLFRCYHEENDFDYDRQEIDRWQLDVIFHFDQEEVFEFVGVSVAFQEIREQVRGIAIVVSK